jgi:hypothetical protein
MWITTEQAIEIYGRFCRARYRGDALTVVMKRASELRKVGDSDGERVWNRVAEKIDPAAARPKLYSAV